jgi:uncharacterized peroxidase-related enzyme
MAKHPNAKQEDSMPKFPIHDLSTAPGASRSILEQSQKSLGFVPKLYSMLAESPALLKGYTTLSAIFEATPFTAAERQTVLLTVSAENACEYCVAAHTAIAGMQGIAPDVVAALRDAEPLVDPKLQALREFTREVVRRRGWPGDPAIAAFLEAGFTTASVLDVILGVGLKTMSNYANHIAGTPLDAAFQSHAWSAPSETVSK